MVNSIYRYAPLLWRSIRIQCFIEFCSRSLKLCPGKCISNGSLFGRLSNCTAALQHWFWSNDLLLNPDKSEASFFGTKPGLRKPGLQSSIFVAGCPIAVSERLKILGVMFDSSLSFDDHVNAVVRACNYHFRSLRYIRHSVPRDIANTLACSIAGSRIDYCNALLRREHRQTTAITKRTSTSRLRYRRAKVTRLGP